MSGLTDLHAPAKLNVFLRVVGRREDGYHLLQSLFVLLDWHDTLHLEARSDGKIRRHDLGMALPEDDLCLRAARLLRDAAGESRGVDIHIEKILPSGAGLGGGSSDAATVMLGLNRLWNLHWPRERLIDLGVRLGADVPFFLGGTSAIVEGIGERLTSVALRPRHYVVVKPPEGVETRAIFSDPTLRRDAIPAIVEGFLADPARMDSMLDGEFAEAQAVIEGRATRIEACNDLQPVAVRHYPMVGEVVAWLKSCWGNGQMTGSGSAAFARETATNASLMATIEGLNLLEARPQGWQGRLCRSLVEHPLRGFAG